MLGAVQGANVVPLYLIAREGLAHRRPQAGGGRAGAARAVRRADPPEFGTTYYDNVMSVFVFSGLAILIVQPRRVARRAALARGR